MTHQFGDKEYHLRRLSPLIYEVAVFQGGKAPEATYFVRGNMCSCPQGWTGDPEHKHIRMVQEFQKVGEPDLMTLWYDELTKEISWVRSV
jgi:hypothetical protein